MRKRDADHMGRVAELPCAICGDMPVELYVDSYSITAKISEPAKLLEQRCRL